MALLAFDASLKGLNDASPVADLLDNTQRQKTASELNAAILTAQCQDKDPKLPSLLKMLNWAQVDIIFVIKRVYCSLFPQLQQSQLDERQISYPKMNNPVFAGLQESS